VLHEVFGLSLRMTATVAFACRGLEAKEIAGHVGLSESAVKKQLRSVSVRLGARGRGHLCAVCSLLAGGFSRLQVDRLLAGTGLPRTAPRGVADSSNQMQSTSTSVQERTGTFGQQDRANPFKPQHNDR
jgi:DNA-binding CsgD family transcriptional regulator